MTTKIKRATEQEIRNALDLLAHALGLPVVQKLYACKTLWDHEITTSNPHELEFYNTVEALKADRPCSDSCGIIELRVVFGQVMQPSRESRGTSADELREREAVYIPLGKKLEALALKEAGSPELALSAVTWALGGLKRARRKSRGKKS